MAPCSNRRLDVIDSRSGRCRPSSRPACRLRVLCRSPSAARLVRPICSRYYVRAGLARSSRPLDCTTLCARRECTAFRVLWRNGRNAPVGAYAFGSIRSSAFSRSSRIADCCNQREVFSEVQSSDYQIQSALELSVKRR